MIDAGHHAETGRCRRLRCEARAPALDSLDEGRILRVFLAPRKATGVKPGHVQQLRTRIDARRYADGIVESCLRALEVFGLSVWLDYIRAA